MSIVSNLRQAITALTMLLSDDFVSLLGVRRHVQVATY